MNPAVIGVFIPIIAVISVFSFLTIIIVAKHRYRAREREKLYDTARIAIEHGQSLPPEVLAALAEPPQARRTAFSDLRTGCILVAVGCGIAIFGAMLGIVGGERDALAPLVGLASIPALIGAAMIILSRFNPNKDQPK